MIVGTAGHIDHGKTTLVRALTGVDTDRLPEEKSRGISIELGYAYVPLAGGGSLGFVDVPGHERFVHTMLAGATGIDFALVVVAADDGVMTQTREHVAILDILGVEHGAVAITKVDRVEAARAAAVESEVAALLAPTRLAGIPAFRVSATRGTGIDALRSRLHAFAATATQAAPQGEFRLAVDRSFTLQGIGTVVTGTVHAGAVEPGSFVRVMPANREARVRGIRANGREAARAVAGERAALNLAGLAREDVARGDWIVAPALASATTRFDARLRWTADATPAERAADALHLHVGTSHAMVRVVALEGGEHAAAQGRLVQLVARESLHLVQGDRFVLRDAAATRTLGGGVVVDPAAPARYRRSPERLASLAALERDAPDERLVALAEAQPGGVDLQRFARAVNLPRAEVQVLADARGLHRAGTGDGAFAVAPRHWEAMLARLDDALAAFHRDHPDDIGPEVARLRRMAFPRIDAAVYHALLDARTAAGGVVRAGAWIRLPSHDMAPSDADRRLLEAIAPALAEGGFDPPWVRELARGAGVADDVVRGVLGRAARRGSVFQIVRDLYYPAGTVAALERIVRELQGSDDEVRAAAFRDRTGLGRKRAIQILEFFDRVGLTRRVRDRHFLRPDALPLVGPPDEPPVAAGREGMC